MAAYTGRQSMRDRGTYYVVREAHKVETDQQVSFWIPSTISTSTDVRDKRSYREVSIPD